LEIRQLKPDDVLDYRTLRLEALRFHPEAFSTSYESELNSTIEQFEKKLKYEHFYIFGAFDDDKLIGMVTLILETGTKLKHKAYIVAMYVRLQYRRLGIGRSLMTEAIHAPTRRREWLRYRLNSNQTPSPNCCRMCLFRHPR
jgi:ribosomal protein S18 acetylase RimI-like enzyme